MPEDIQARFARKQSLSIGILLFPEVEVLDFAGPFEVFSVARVALAGATGAPVTARHCMQVCPHVGFDDAPADATLS